MLREKVFTLWASFTAGHSRKKSWQKLVPGPEEVSRRRYQNCVTLPSSGGSSKLWPPSFVILLGIDIHGRNETQQRQMVWWVRKYAFYLSLFRPTRHGRASPRQPPPRAASPQKAVTRSHQLNFNSFVSTLSIFCCYLDLRVHFMSSPAAPGQTPSM